MTLGEFKEANAAGDDVGSKVEGAVAEDGGSRGSGEPGHSESCRPW